MSAPRSHLFIGAACVGAGLLIAALVYLHPEQLRAPAWVAYTASAAFVFGGLTAIANQLESARLRAWLPVATLVALITPGAWFALGSGNRQCRVSIPFVVTTVSDSFCRGAFGLGALIGAVILAWAVRRAIHSTRLPSRSTTSADSDTLRDPS